MSVQLSTFSPHELKIHTESASSIAEPSNIQIHIGERKGDSDGSERLAAPVSLDQLIRSIREYSIRRREELGVEILAIEPEKGKLSPKIWRMYTMGIIGGLAIVGSLLYLAVQNTSFVNHPSADDTSTRNIAFGSLGLGGISCIAFGVDYYRYGRRSRQLEKHQQNKHYHSIIISQYGKEDIATKAACLYMDHLKQTKKEKKIPIPIEAYIESPSTLSKIFFESQMVRS